MILKHKTWKIGRLIFHLLQFRLPNSTYYAIKWANMEIMVVSPIANGPGFDGIIYANIKYYLLLKHGHYK